jgi:hypothetical protein
MVYRERARFELGRIAEQLHLGLADVLLGKGLDLLGGDSMHQAGKLAHALPGARVELGVGQQLSLPVHALALHEQAGEEGALGPGEGLVVQGRLLELVGLVVHHPQGGVGVHRGDVERAQRHGGAHAQPGVGGVAEVALGAHLLEQPIGEVVHGHQPRHEVGVLPTRPREDALDVVGGQRPGLAGEVGLGKVERGQRGVLVGPPGQGAEGGLHLLDDVVGVEVAHGHEEQPPGLAQHLQVGLELLGLEGLHALEGALRAVLVGVALEQGVVDQQAQPAVGHLQLVLQPIELALAIELHLAGRERRLEEGIHQQAEGLVPLRLEGLGPEHGVVVARGAIQLAA